MGGAHQARDAGQACKDCSDPPLPGGRRCKACRGAHNARERERRAELKRKRRCWACTAQAVKDEQGRWLSTCQAHRGTGWRNAD
jgi:hypothetical protein